MARIKCKTPSPGKPIQIVGVMGDTISNANWVTIAEAPDFSVPDTSNRFPVRDPLDASYAIRAGEVFFLRPLLLHHLSAVTEDRTIRLRLLREDGADFTLFQATVQTTFTVELPIQGLSLFKRNPASANGDRLQLRSGINPFWRYWGAAEERIAADHLGVEV